MRQLEEVAVMGSGAERIPLSKSCEPWRDFIETAEALRSELASRLQKEFALSPGTTRYFWR